MLQSCWGGERCGVVCGERWQGTAAQDEDDGGALKKRLCHKLCMLRASVLHTMCLLACPQLRLEQCVELSLKGRRFSGRL